MGLRDASASKNSTSVKCANNHYHLLQERKVTYITVTNLQRMSTMLDLDGMGRDVAIGYALT